MSARIFRTGTMTFCITHAIASITGFKALRMAARIFKAGTTKVLRIQATILIMSTNNCNGELVSSIFFLASSIELDRSFVELLTSCNGFKALISSLKASWRASIAGCKALHNSCIASLTSSHAFLRSDKTFLPSALLTH